MPKGIIILLNLIGTYLKLISMIVDFLIVKVLSTYNAIICRPLLRMTQAIMSTYHLKVMFPMEYGVEKVRDDNVVAR